MSRTKYSQLPTAMRGSGGIGSWSATATGSPEHVSAIQSGSESPRSSSPSYRSSSRRTTSSRGLSQKTRFHDERYTWHRSMRDYRLRKAKYYRAMAQVSRNPYKRMQYMFKARKHDQGALAHHRKHVMHDAKRRLSKERDAAVFRGKKPSRYMF